MKQPPENQIAGLGSAVSYCSDVRGEAPAANTFWCIMTSKIAPGGNCLVIYFSLQWCILRIKQLYGQEVPEQCFGIQKKSSRTSFLHILAQLSTVYYVIIESKILGLGSLQQQWKKLKSHWCATNSGRNI